MELREKHPASTACQCNSTTARTAEHNQECHESSVSGIFKKESSVSVIQNVSTGF